MEIPTFTKWWEVTIFLTLGLLLLPFFIIRVLIGSIQQAVTE
jgi:hypothetical protein